MKIIGITGTLGAGKGTIVDLLLKEYGFAHFSARAFLLEEIGKRGLEANRDSMTLVANDLRKTHASASYIIDQLLERAANQGKNCVIESVRTSAEIRSLKKHSDCILFAVDASAEIRYERIKKRASETDHISYATFLENERRELSSEDPNKQNLSACIQQADSVFLNNGSIEELLSQVRKTLHSLGILPSA